MKSLTPNSDRNDDWIKNVPGYDDVEITEDALFPKTTIKKEDDHSNDAMIAFMLSDSQQSDFARTMQEVGIADAIQNGEFHITLKYLGDISNLDKQALIEACQEMTDSEPMLVMIGSIGVFDQDDNRGVYHLQVGGSDIHKFRARLVAKLIGIDGIIEDTYPKYIPHITIVTAGEIPDEALQGISNRYTGRELAMQDFQLIFGNERHTFPLLRPQTIKKQANRAMLRVISIKQRGGKK